MSSDTIELNKNLRDYLIASSVKESKVLKDLRKETSTLDESQMQISPEQGTTLFQMYNNAYEFLRDPANRPR